MLTSNQLRKDLEGFLEDLYKTGHLPARLKEENLVAKVSPKIDEFLISYNSSLYNQERIQKLGNSLRKKIYNYAKENTEFRNYVCQIERTKEIMSLCLGGWYYLLGSFLTGNSFVGTMALVIGYTFGRMKRFPITEEYKKLQTKRKQKIEEILNS